MGFAGVGAGAMDAGCEGFGSGTSWTRGTEDRSIEQCSRIGDTHERFQIRIIDDFWTVLVTY